jgi:hypothetical protein
MGSRNRRETKKAIERISKKKNISKKKAKKRYVTRMKDMDFLNW